MKLYNADGYMNLLTGYGTKRDNSTAYQFVPEPYAADTELTRLYESNGLFTKIIDAPAEEAVKHGFDIGLNNPDIEKYVDKALARLKWKEKAITAIKWARLFGGSIIFMFIDDGRESWQPVDWNNVTGIDELRVYERAVVEPDYNSLYTQSAARRGRASKFGKPEYYDINSVSGTFRAHESRCLVFKNGELPENSTNSRYRFWGLPEYPRIKKELREAMTSPSLAVKLLDRSVQAIYKMKGLANLVSTEDGSQQAIKRLELIDMARGILNSIAIDAEGEDYDFKTSQLSGVKDIIDSTCNMLSAVTNIPQSILFGRSPAGMNATGESDLENYYNYINRIQEGMLFDCLGNLLDLIFQAGIANRRIDEMPDYDLEFNPLWNLSDTEQATVDQTKAATQQTRAQTAQIYVDMGALDPTEVRRKLAEAEEFSIEEILDDLPEDDLWAQYTQPEPETPETPETQAPGSQSPPQQLPQLNAQPNTDKSDIPGVGVLVVKNGYILCGKRTDTGEICGPGGHIEDGETPEQAAMREVREEFGITSNELIPIADGQYVCNDFSGKVACNDGEMTSPCFMTMEELYKYDLFKPFEHALDIISALSPKTIVKSPQKWYNISRGTSDDDDTKWITVNGAAVPLKDGELQGSVGEKIESESGEHGKGESTRQPKNPSIKSYGTTDTSSAGAGGKEDSLQKYIDSNGKLTPEREALHQDIIDETFNGASPPDGQPTFNVLGGGTASGKSTLLDSGAVTLPDGNVTIDSDAIKSRFPEYNDMIAKGGKDTKNAAAYSHEESSALAKRMLGIANEGGFNVTLDGTGDGSVESLSKKITDAKNAGMRVAGTYVTIPTQMAVDRSMARGKETGRIVQEETIREIHSKVSQILPKTAHLFDDVKLYDNSGGTPVLIATGGNGKSLEPVKGQEKLFQGFIDKGNE